jgi:serine/threonine-protein kinase
MAEHSLGHARESQQNLDRLSAKYGQDCPFCVAEVYAWRGEKDLAFAWLERAFAQHSSALTEIKEQRLLDSLHGDARYTALLSRMNLPE